MTSEEILKIEIENHNAIHIFRAGNFFHLWNKSAFFFSKHFFEYEVHCKFIRKIGAEMLYLGFPNTSLDKIKEMSLQKKMSWEQLDDNHFVIRNFIVFSDYEIWKRQKFEESLAKNDSTKINATVQKNCDESTRLKISVSKKKDFTTPQKILYAYKEFYETTRYILGRTSEVSRSMRVSLVQRLRDECFDLLDHLDFCQMNLDVFNENFANRKFCQIRQKLRLLMDLKQITSKQWFYVTEKMHNIKKTLGLQSFDSRAEGECQPGSSSPLAPEA